tara:strand:+ start:76 stop:342 length:267 start_codon:yes stop_codon:yes gene_type:complete
MEQIKETIFNEEESNAPEPKKIRSDALKRAQARYYVKNRDKYLAYFDEYHKTWNTETKICKCGQEVKNYSIHKHRKSKKCIEICSKMT